MMVTAKISGTGSGVCALSGRDCDGLTIAIDNDQPIFLGWKGLRQILNLRLAQNGKLPQPSAAAPGSILATRSIPTAAEVK